MAEGTRCRSRVDVQGRVWSTDANARASTVCGVGMLMYPCRTSASSHGQSGQRPAPEVTQRQWPHVPALLSQPQPRAAGAAWQSSAPCCIASLQHARSLDTRGFFLSLSISQRRRGPRVQLRAGASISFLSPSTTQSDSHYTKLHVQEPTARASLTKDVGGAALAEVDLVSGRFRRGAAPETG